MSVTDPLPVVFRWHLGVLTAYFPTLEWAPGFITCYTHAEQHGGADRSWLRKGTPATPEELSLIHI